MNNQRIILNAFVKKIKRTKKKHKQYKEREYNGKSQHDYMPQAKE